MKNSNLTIKEILKKNNDIYARAIKEALARQMASIANNEDQKPENSEET